MHFAAIIYGIIGIIEVISEAIGSDTLRFITKPLLMPVLIFYFYSSVKFSFNKLHKIMIAALVFSWMGDMFLMFVRFNEFFFLAGLASFLLNWSQRMRARGYSASEFNLRMTRAEIGSYLGLTLETVSRTFSLFQKQKLLQVDKRYVRLHDLAALERAFSGASNLRVH